MDRRKFLIGTGALAAGGWQLLPAMGSDTSMNHSSGAPRILPGRLNPGDTVGLVTPGSPVTAEQVTEAVEKIEALGLKCTYEDTVLDEYGYFAGKDQDRADELMGMFARPDIKGIWCVRGGYGSIRILDLLDYELIARNPKVFIGYSDITALHTAIFRKAGLVTYHGPLGVSDFNRFTRKSLKKIIMDPGEHYKFPYSREKDSKGNPEFDPRVLVPGEAEGLLTGGNISVLDSLIGTPYEPDFKDGLVYLEEIEEKTYRVDKMLFHLLSATNLKSAAGIVLGVFKDCNVNDEPRLSLSEALEDLLVPLGIPVMYGLSFGHIDRTVCIPNGVRAGMKTKLNRLQLLEPSIM